MFRLAGASFSKFTRLFIAIALLLASFAIAGGHASAKAGGQPGVVYTLTNATTGNAVAIFDRAADGTLTADGSVSTGGIGTGAGLGSQGSLVLSGNGRWLFAVNAGSNDVSVFSTNGHS